MPMRIISARLSRATDIAAPQAAWVVRAGAGLGALAAVGWFAVPSVLPPRSTTHAAHCPDVGLSPQTAATCVGWVVPKHEHRPAEASGARPTPIGS